jgi:hypothetical protein
MAMTKKEKEYVENLEKELRIRAALVWTPKVEEDLPPPIPGSGGETSGWVYNRYNLRVDTAWSSSVSHGTGYTSRKHSSYASQKSIPLFSTRLLALKALRNEVELDAAMKLAEIDKLIELQVLAMSYKDL